MPFHGEPWEDIEEREEPDNSLEARFERQYYRLLNAGTIIEAQRQQIEEYREFLRLLVIHSACICAADPPLCANCQAKKLLKENP